jgi:hypothetical protein
MEPLKVDKKKMNIIQIIGCTIIVAGLFGVSLLLVNEANLV